MTDPVRLRDGAGPAGDLLRGAKLTVPSAARGRALAFTATAAGLTASGTALAASGGALAKSIALYVSLGVVGGGLASFGVSRALHHVEQPPVEVRMNTLAPRTRALSLESSARTSPRADVPVLAPTSPAASADTASTASGASAPAAARESASPRSPRPEPSSAPARRSLFDEQRMIESARTAITRGDAMTGLKRLNDYEQSFPRGQFQPEALALRVEALVASGDAGRARILASEFARRYPQHPLQERVRASAGSR